MEDKQRMFQNPFSAKGRIRRLEYGLSYLIYVAYYYTIVLILALSGILEDVNWSFLIIFLLLIPAYWFLIAQGAKRCHDRGNSGWFQLVPFYAFWMLFAGSDYGENEYGFNPKGEVNESVEDMIDNIGVPEQE